MHHKGILNVYFIVHITFAIEDNGKCYRDTWFIATFTSAMFMFTKIKIKMSYKKDIVDNVTPWMVNMVSKVVHCL